MCANFESALVIIISAVYLVSGQNLTSTEENILIDSIVSTEKSTMIDSNSFTSKTNQIQNYTNYIATTESFNRTIAPTQVTEVVDRQKTTKNQSTQTTGENSNNMDPGVIPVEVVDQCLELSSIKNLDTQTQDEFLNKLTDSCRYDRLVKPPSGKPSIVYIQIDMNHIESADHLQFKAHIMVQLSYADGRLEYKNLSPKRGNLVGEQTLRNKIWVPHIIVENERLSTLMGLSDKDVFVQVTPEGKVTYSYRMTTTFYCWMNLKKFPFDHQICTIKWVSWAYNISNLELRWEPNRPFIVAQNLHLTEYVMEEKWTNSIIEEASFLTGGLAGNYSAVVFSFKLRREVGYYIMDYFLPSVLLVCMSWVTFWLQADAAPPRVTLGSSTMLSFITLNGGLTKNLPKVSYIKASEIWFIGCTTFIFFSLAEFAFVNVIWRRKKGVELKKQNSKHILKGALTPRLARKEVRKSESFNTLYKTRSCTSLDKEDIVKNTRTNYLTVHSFPSSLSVPKITREDDTISDSVTTINMPEECSKSPTPEQPTWTTMTPQDIAIWIDRKSRIVFPVAFLIFNILYWSFVYAL